MMKYKKIHSGEYNSLSAKKRIAGISMVSMIALYPGFALANQNSLENKVENSGTGAENSQGFGEIIVTANRREESIQKVPISISAVSAEALGKSKIMNVSDIGQLVPSVEFRNEFGVASPFTYIRGVGNSGFATNSISPVGFYSDGVYIGQNIAQGLQLFDVERIEVLRGPQGTLFGRNTTGGLINVISRKPSLTVGLQGQVDATIGEYGTFNANGAVGDALGSTAAFRIAVSRQGDNGAFRNVNPHLGKDRIGAIDATAARGQLLWSPDSRFTALLNVHWGESNGGIVPHKPGFFADATGSNCPPGAIGGVYGNGCTDPYGHGVTGSPNYRETTADIAGFERIRAFGTALELNYFAGDYTITSTTAWDKATLRRLQDADGHELSFMSASFTANARYWSQELRIASPGDAPFTWVAGLNYYGDRNRAFNHFGSGDADAGNGFGLGIAQRTFVRTQSYAAFLDATYHFTDSLRLTAGARWTVDKRRASISTWATNAYGVVHDPAAPTIFVPALSASGFISEAQAEAALLAPLIPHTELKRTWRKWSGRASLSYDLDRRNMVYASWAHGFKGGDFNGAAIISPIEVGISNPEYVDNYEIGYKGALLDGAVRLAIDAFYMDYSNQQVQSYNDPTAVFPAISNAAAARIKGFEFESTFLPVQGLQLTLNGTYLNAKFTKYDDPVAGNRSGNRLANSPNWTLSGSARYGFAAGDGELAIQANARWSSDYYFDVDNSPGLYQPSYAVVDMRIDYSFANERLTIGAFAKNLFDKKYLSNAFDLRSFGENVIQIARPRLLGVDASYKF